MKVAAMAVMLASVAGCTVTPLYGTSTASISPQDGGVAAQLASVEVTEATDRVGQELRNHLIFLLGGGGGQPANPAYRLQLATVAHVSRGPSISVSDVTLEPSSGFLALRSDYSLVEADTGRVVSAGTRAVQAPFDNPGQNYASQRAVRDAENRAARELAEVLRLVVAQELQRATSTSVPDIVTTPEDVDRRRIGETGSFPRRQ
ncbi:LPS assembly lipoprotein LptE [Mesorhizobium sp. CAU 1741]